jgi:hypothetical protein
MVVVKSAAVFGIIDPMNANRDLEIGSGAAT